MRSPSAEDRFSYIPFKGAKFLGDKSYDTPITVTKGRKNPEISHDEPQMFQDVSPVTSRLLDTKYILTPKVFRQNFDFSLKLRKVPQKSDLEFHDPKENSVPLPPMGLRVLKRPLHLFLRSVDKGENLVKKLFLVNVDLRLPEGRKVPHKLAPFDVS